MEGALRHHAIVDATFFTEFDMRGGYDERAGYLRADASGRAIARREREPGHEIEAGARWPR